MEILRWLAKIDTHIILIVVLLVIALWAAVKSVTASRNKSWLVLMGVALGGAGILIFLKWYNKRLLKEVNEIQKQRDVIADEINTKKGELAQLMQQDSVETEKLNIQLAAQEKARQEKENTERELNETISQLETKFNL